MEGRAVLAWEECGLGGLVAGAPEWTPSALVEVNWEGGAGARRAVVVLRGVAQPEEVTQNSVQPLLEAVLELVRSGGKCTSMRAEKGEPKKVLAGVGKWAASGIGGAMRHQS